MRRSLGFVSLFALLVIGCAEQQSQRCSEICRREAECAEGRIDRGFEINRAECVKVCSELDKDAQGARLVTAHQECIVAAGDDCDAVLRCD